MKILIAGDNHFNYDIITELNYKYRHFDLKLHTGDSQFDFNEISLLDSWIKVCGNNDYLMTKTLPKFEIIETKYGNIFLTHGHNYNIDFDLSYLNQVAKENNCKFAVYGHSHVLNILKKDSIIFLNPGSISFPRLTKNKTYLELYLSENECKVIVKSSQGQNLEQYKF